MDIISLSNAKKANKKNRSLEQIVDYTPSTSNPLTIRDRVDEVEKEVDKVTFYRDEIKKKTYLAQLERKKIRQAHGLAIEQGLNYLNYENFSSSSRIDSQKSKKVTYSPLDKTVSIEPDGVLQTRLYYATSSLKEVYIDFEFLEGEPYHEIEIEIHDPYGLKRKIQIKNKSLVHLDEVQGAQQLLVRLSNVFVPSANQTAQDGLIKIDSLSLIWK